MAARCLRSIGNAGFEAKSIHTLDPFSKENFQKSSLLTVVDLMLDRKQFLLPFYRAQLRVPSYSFAR
jgi:hypothetical protein